MGKTPISELLKKELSLDLKSDNSNIARFISKNIKIEEIQETEFSENIKNAVMNFLPTTIGSQSNVEKWGNFIELNLEDLISSVDECEHRVLELNVNSLNENEILCKQCHKKIFVLIFNSHFNKWIVKEK